MPDYDIPDDFMKFSNNVYILLTDHFNVPPHRAQAGLNGLLRFFHRHGRRNLDLMTLDIWVGQRDNPNRQEAEMSVQYDMANDLRNIINHLIVEGQQVTPETVEHELVERFGIRARGKKNPKNTHDAEDLVTEDLVTKNLGVVDLGVVDLDMVEYHKSLHILFYLDSIYGRSCQQFRQ